MHYFRHAPTAFWSAVLLVLVILGVVGWSVSSDEASPASSIAVSAAPPKAGIDGLVTRLPSLYPSLAAGSGLAWARDYATAAREARHQFEESKSRPELAPLWRDVTDAADQLALVDPNNAQEFTAKAGLLGDAVGRLQWAYDKR